MLGFRLTDLFSFEKNLSLTLIRIVYFLGLCGIALAAIVTAFGALGVMRYSFTAGLGTLLAAVLGGTLGAMVWRVVCELWMVIFGIYDRLGQVREVIERGSTVNGPR